MFLSRFSISSIALSLSLLFSGFSCVLPSACLSVPVSVCVCLLSPAHPLKIEKGKHKKQTQAHPPLLSSPPSHTRTHARTGTHQHRHRLSHPRKTCYAASFPFILVIPLYFRLCITCISLSVCACVCVAGCTRHLVPLALLLSSERTLEYLASVL